MEGRFSIIQDSKTQRSWLRHQVGDEVTLRACPEKDFPYLRLLASLIRNSDDPNDLMKFVAEQLEDHGHSEDEN